MHISVLSLHTSPAAQPGQGDAGGMNVYVDQSVRALAAAGHKVDVFTADPGGINGLGHGIAVGDSAVVGAGQATTVQITENVRLHQLPIETASKDELADAIDELALLLLDQPSFTTTDLIWAHYWISAEAALRSQELRSQQLRTGDLPGHEDQARTAESGGTAEPARPAESARLSESPRIIVSMHTIGAVKNRDSETSHERPQRLQAEERIASVADMLVANTPAERRDLIHELAAAPASVVVARPGVDHERFAPGDRAQARAELNVDPDENIVLYVGRMQFIKGTDVVVDALSGLRENNPHLASRTRGILLGAVSGQVSSVSGQKDVAGQNDAAGNSIRLTGSSPYLRDLASAIAAEPSLEVRSPVPAHELATYYQAADILLVPSRSESFGLVAAEAAASGLPALASAVGGLPDIVEHECSGVLIADHNPRHWALALERILLDDELRGELATHAAKRSARFDWAATVSAVLGALEVPEFAASTTMTSTEETSPTASLVGRSC